MSDKLIINSVQAENFGGLSNRRLDIPGETMVVVHGRNETGKSTFTELITWLLVGPSTDSDVIRRLGRADEILVGEMSGQLKGNPFLSRASFRITPKSWEISAKSERIYEIDGLLTPEQWLSGLRDIDRSAMEGIYRIWGQQLHQGGDADSEMHRAGLGSIAMAIDPRALVKRLVDSSKPGSKIGEGDSSFNSISADLKEVSVSVGRANNNIVVFNTKVSELAELESRLAELRQQGIDLARRRANLVSFQEFDEMRDAESKAQAALRAQPDAPEVWLPAVEQIHRLRSVIDACETQRKLLSDARRRYDQAVSDVGMPPATSPAEVIQQVSIKSHHMGAVGKAVGDVDHAEKDHEEAAKELATRKTELAAVESDATRAAADLGVDPEQVRVAKVESARLAFQRAMGEFSSVESDLSHAHAGAIDAEAAVAGAAETLRLAELRWKDTGIGTSPREWRVRGGDQIASSGDISSARKFAPVLALAIAALVAAALGQWLLVILIVVAAVVALATTPRATEVRADPLAGDTAEQHASAETTLDLLKSELANAKTTLSRHEERLEIARDRVLAVGTDFGIDLPDDPHEIQAVLDKWSAAKELVEKLDRARGRCGEAERAFDSAAASALARVEQLQHLLTDFGLPAGIEPNSAESVANQHVDLLGRANDLRRQEQSAESSESTLAELLGPVAVEVSGWKLHDILKQVEEAEATHISHLAMVDDVRNAAARISDLVGDDIELEALISGGIDPASAATEISEIDPKSAGLDKERQALVEQIGVVKEEIQRQQREQQLADLRLRQGSLEELRAEIGFEVASRRLASLVLQHVADEHQRKNQPDLIRATAKLACSAVDQWAGVEVRVDGANSTSLMVNMVDGSVVPAVALSTGARAMLYLSLRVAMAEHDTKERGVALPLICDDPLVHIDDERAEAAMSLLAEASKSRQVVMFTCHQRTMEVAKSIGVTTVRI